MAEVIFTDSNKQQKVKSHQWIVKRKMAGSRSTCAICWLMQVINLGRAFFLRHRSQGHLVNSRLTHTTMEWLTTVQIDANGSRTTVFISGAATSGAAAGSDPVAWFVDLFILLALEQRFQQVGRWSGQKALHTKTSKKKIQVNRIEFLQSSILAGCWRINIG